MLAKYLIRNGEVDKGVKLLDESIDKHPELVDACFGDLDVINEPKICDLIRLKDEGMNEKINELVLNITDRKNALNNLLNNDGDWLTSYVLTNIDYWINKLTGSLISGSGYFSKRKILDCCKEIENKLFHLIKRLEALDEESHNIRVQAQGKAVIGVEIPNAQLPLTFGKDIAGNSFVADLAKMPHLLIAGATGVGKSVFINVLIMNTLHRSTPNDVRLLLIDSKMLELSAYEGISHLLTPVITDAKRAAVVLRGMVNEMGERYKLMAKMGAKNIEGYNAILLTEKVQDVPKDGSGEIRHKRLPYIVVVINEFSDLMMIEGGEVENSLVTLSEMGYAAGIHLIVATQQQSADVITDLIKANFPACI